MKVITLICKGLDALEDKLTQEALDAEKEIRGEEDEKTKEDLHERVGYLRGMRDAYELVRCSLEAIIFKQ